MHKYILTLFVVFLLLLGSGTISPEANDKFSVSILTRGGANNKIYVSLGGTFDVQFILHYPASLTNNSVTYRNEIKRSAIHIELPGSDFKILAGKIIGLKKGENHYIRIGRKDDSCRLFSNCTWVECHFRDISGEKDSTSCIIRVKRIGFQDSRLVYYSWYQNPANKKIVCYPKTIDQNSYSIYSEKRCNNLKSGTFITYPRSKTDFVVSINKPAEKNLVKKAGDKINFKAELKNIKDTPLKAGGIILLLPSDTFEVVYAKSKSIYAKSSTGEDSNFVYAECNFQPFSFENALYKSSRFCTVEFRVKENPTRTKSYIKYLGWIKDPNDKIKCYPKRRITNTENVSNENSCDTLKSGILISIPEPSASVRLSGLHESGFERKIYAKKNPGDEITLIPRLTNSGDASANYGELNVLIPKNILKILQTKNNFANYYHGEVKVIEFADYELVKCIFPSEIKINSQRNCEIKLSVKSPFLDSSLKNGEDNKPSKIYYSGFLGSDDKNDKNVYYSPQSKTDYRIIETSDIPGIDDHEYPNLNEELGRFMAETIEIRVSGPKPKVRIINPTEKKLILENGDILPIEIEIENIGKVNAPFAGISLILPKRYFEINSVKSKAFGSKNYIHYKADETIGTCYFPFGIQSGNNKYCRLKVKAISVPSTVNDYFKLKVEGFVEDEKHRRIKKISIFENPTISFSMFSLQKKNFAIALEEKKPDPIPKLSSNLVTYKGTDFVYVSAILENSGGGRGKNASIHIELPEKYFSVETVKGGNKKNIKGNKNILCSEKNCVYGLCLFDSVRPSERKVCTVVFKAKSRYNYISAYPRIRGQLSSEAGRLFCMPNKVGAEKCRKNAITGRKIIVNKKEDKGQRRYLLHSIKNCFPNETKATNENKIDNTARGFGKISVEQSNIKYSRGRLLFNVKNNVGAEIGDLRILSSGSGCSIVKNYPTKLPYNSLAKITANCNNLNPGDPFLVDVIISYTITSSEGTERYEEGGLIQGSGGE